MMRPQLSIAFLGISLLFVSTCSGAGIIPTLDGSPTPISTGTYPRANFLSDGSIIGAYTLFANNSSTIAFSRSTDRGATWLPLDGIAAQGPTATSDIDNPYPLQLPSGRILVAFRNHTKDTAGAYTFFRIAVSFSDDNGASWNFLSNPASDPGPVNGNWEPFLRNAVDGSLQIYYSRENNATDQDSLMRTSTDGGLTWSDALTISGGDIADARDGMLGVTTTAGSALIAVFESKQGEVFTVNSVMSPDDGKTWGNRQRVYTPTGNANNAGAPQVVNVGGALVVSFMTDEDTGNHNWVQGASSKLVTSGDGGSTWGHKLLFSDVQSNWPGLLTLDDSTFLAMVDHGGSIAQRVTLS